MNKKDENQKSVWWRNGIIFFTRISGYIIGPILISLFLGKYLDRRFNSEPWWFLGLTALAFIFSCMAIVRATSKYIDETKTKNGK